MAGGVRVKPLEFSVASGPFTSGHSLPRSSRKDAYKNSGVTKRPPLADRTVVAWDMEGMNLSGDNKPQHPVLFGNSRDIDNPLISRRLGMFSMLNYIIDTGKRYPYALHVGYGFRYDATMILQDLDVRFLARLWKKNHVRFIDWSTGDSWNIGLIPGKKLTITKRYKHGGKHTVIIQDYSSFFGGKKFLTAAADLLKNELSEEDRRVIAHGKAERGSNLWADLPEVRHYWEREIVLIQRVFEKFRDVMYQAGFALREWYGPGALANYINSVHDIRPKIAAAQVTSGVMPLEVHEASKVAFSGGRFELFQAGRIKGPVYGIDINSAYPFALTLIPSLDPSVGRWRHETNPNTIRRFGFYRVKFNANFAKPFEKRPMPLFWRDRRGLITYPNKSYGWYASPETRMVQGMPGVQILDGWYWDSDETEFPWEFLRGMYATRQKLGKQNLLSMPFKLGPNSLYGKYAQTIGWDEKAGLPPKSHALPVAAWITSFCRAQLWSVMRQIPGKVVAVETDSVYTTVDPSTLKLEIGDSLGQWSISQYEEMMYLQSGMYHTMNNGEWTGTRSRGMHATDFPAEMAESYLRSLEPGVDFGKMVVPVKPRFIGIGAALATPNPKASLAVWRASEREIGFGDTGKRRHVSKACQECADGYTPYDKPHRLVVSSQSDGRVMSHPRALPWEQKHTDEIQEIRDGIALEGELIHA